MVWFKRNKKSDVIKTKSSSSCDYPSFYESLYASSHYDLAAYQAALYYTKTAPLYTAINLVSQEVASIQPIIKNIKTGKLINDHPLLDLLKSPNSDESYQDFIRAFSSFLMIAGENYLIATGLENSEPREILIVPPQSINITSWGNGISEITYQTNNLSLDFIRQQPLQNKTNRERFFTQTNMQEIWQTIDFNPKVRSYRIRGMSPFTPLFYAIEQYINSDIHNLSLLKRGGRISGAFIYENELADDQFTRLREQINEIYGGAENAGKIALLEGENVSYTELGMNLKDMDFLNLKNSVETAIYNALHIPLPIVKTETMTMSNTENGKLALYDNKVLPLIKRIFQELTLMLMPRYKNSEDLMLTFDPQEIPALESRRLAQLQIKVALGVMTMNEVRMDLNLDPVAEGDAVFGPASTIPIAGDDLSGSDDTDNSDDSAGDSSDDSSGDDDNSDDSSDDKPDEADK